jgi:hypothetical protein
MNEDTLILYYYNDGLSDAKRREVATAIADDPALAARYDELCRELNAFAESDTAGVSAHARERWHDTIRQAARSQAEVRKPAPRTFNPMSFAWGAALAAALVLAVVLNREPVTPLIETPVQASAAFERGLQVHFRDTREQLASMSIDSSAQRADLVRQIINQNRLFERAAERNDAGDLARVLRAFEPILMQLAAEDLGDADAQSLQAQLAFELNVMLTKLSRDASNETETAQTGIQT